MGDKRDEGRKRKGPMRVVQEQMGAALGMEEFATSAKATSNRHIALVGIKTSWHDP